MPLYEYKCLDCEDEFEELVFSATAEEELTCPACKSKNVQRKLSLFGFSSGNQGGEKKFVSSSTTQGCSSCHAPSCAGCGKI